MNINYEKSNIIYKGINNIMNNIKEYIQEKLIVNKNVKQRESRDLSKVVYNNVSREIHFKSPVEEHTHYNKMEAYKKKGSNPQRLVNSIKNKQKLIIRWWVAVMEDWLDCALVFRDEIVKRGYATEDELDAYMLNQYNRYKHQQPYADKFKNYLDEVGVKYDND